jgi:hypothetical protein
MYTFASANTASFITGLGISSIIFLILTAQVWIYFWRHHDNIRSRKNKQSKAFVAFIWLMQAAQMVITTRISCTHMTVFEDRSQFIDHTLIEWAVYTGIGSLTTSLVHVIFISRIFRLEKSLCGRRRLSFVLIVFCIMEQVFGLLSAIFIFKLHDHPDYSTMLTWSLSASLACSLINDLLIAGTLAYILNTHRTVSRSANRMITKLVIFCSQTGLITTVAASITIGIWAVCRFEVYHLYMCSPIGGVYATCLLANFIARESYLQPQTNHGTEMPQISFARFTQVIHTGLPDNDSGHQETLVQRKTDSSKTSSC